MHIVLRFLFLFDLGHGDQMVGSVLVVVSAIRPPFRSMFFGLPHQLLRIRRFKGHEIMGDLSDLFLKFFNAGQASEWKAGAVVVVLLLVVASLLTHL
jgi:hypothetical protein